MTAMPAVAARGSWDDANVLRIETPEQVALSYELAGPGSRFAAFVFDAVLLFGLILLLVLGAILSVFWFGTMVEIGGRTAPIVAAVMVLVVFALFWGWFVYFEAFRDGQTPGKKRFGLRVVYEGGHALTLRGAAIRNLLRLVDSQPLPSWLLGGAMILLHPRAQRLGDLAAGTIVVRERTAVSLPEEAASSGPPRLSEDEYDVLRGYAQRRDDLERNARLRLALKLAPHFARFHGDGRAAAPGATWPGNAASADGMLMQLYADESGRRATAGARAGSGSPAAAALLRRQRDRWAGYRLLLGRARERGLANLEEADVSHFAAAYREVAADLARARTYGASPAMLYTLERWVGAGHNLLYARPAAPPRRLRAWITAGLPRTVRRRAPAILAAALLFFGTALITVAAVSGDPGRARAVLPEHMIARAEAGAARQAAGRGYAEVPEIAMPIFSSTIIANNVQVSFAAFAGGILLGAGTGLLLLLNGIVLGGVAGLFHAEGLDLYLWSFVLPHGVLELTAIVIAGGAGFLLGSAVLMPGRRTRRDALVEHGRDAISLLGGVVIMLLIAGLIEGFISPSTMSAAAKLALGTLSGVLLLPYLLFAGRSSNT